MLVFFCGLKKKKVDLKQIAFESESVNQTSKRVFQQLTTELLTCNNVLLLLLRMTILTKQTLFFYFLFLFL